MNPLSKNDRWCNEDVPSSSGKCSGNGESVVDRKRGKLSSRSKGDTEMTLMKLRRLGRTLMSKNERHRFEERKLCRTNIVKFLTTHLSTPCERILHLTLDLFCLAVPRLGNRTDVLLKPVVPKVMQRLGSNEGRDIKLKVLHFLRAYLRHTRNLSSFIDQFLLYGMESNNEEIKISCSYGLGIVFDLDIEDNLYSRLVISIGNNLVHKSSSVALAAYRALKKMHETLYSDRFYKLLSLATPEAKEIYQDYLMSEESDSFLALQDSDCSAVVAAYQMKRRSLGLTKDFGITDPALLDRIGMTRDSERAAAVNCFTLAIKRSLWTHIHLENHIMDLLKLGTCFLTDLNRPIQMDGFDILKEIIVRMSFYLTPHLPCIVKVLRLMLTSPNSKLRSRADRILYKLMRCVHPMTVIWELLPTRNEVLKEAVLRFVLDKLRNIPYYELDLVALFNILGHNLENNNSNIQKISRECVILLMNIMNDCPINGIRTDAIRFISHNCSLQGETLKAIGIPDQNVEETMLDSDSYSDEDTTDTARSNTCIPLSSSASVISKPPTRGTISTAEKSSDWCKSNKSILSFAKTCDNDQETVIDEELLETHSEMCSTALDNDGCSFQWNPQGRIREDPQRAVDNPFRMMPNILYRIPSEEPIPLIHFNRMQKNTKRSEMLSESCSLPEVSHFKIPCHGDKLLHCTPRKGWNNIASEDINIETKGVENFKKSLSDLQAKFQQFIATDTPCYFNSLAFIGARNSLNAEPKAQQKKARSRFHLKTDLDGDYLTGGRAVIDEGGGGDKKSSPNKFNTKSFIKRTVPNDNAKVIVESYEENGIRVDRLNPEICNFNITEVEQAKTMESIKEVSEGEEEFEGSVHICPVIVYPESTSQDFNNIDRENFKICENHTTKANFLRKDDRAIKQQEYDSKIVGGNCEQGSRRTKETSKETKDFQKIKECGDLQSLSPRKYLDENSRMRRNSMTDLKVCPELVDAAAGTSEDFLELNSNVVYTDQDGTPFLPKSKQLPRTPVAGAKAGNVLAAHTTIASKSISDSWSQTRKVTLERKGKTVGGQEKRLSHGNTNKTATEDSGRKLHSAGSRRESPTKKIVISAAWASCQWRRDLEYAAKGGSCQWAEKFELFVEILKPYQSLEVAETEMKKVLDDLSGKAWKAKEEAMLHLIRLAKHHPEVVYDNTPKIIVSLCHEIKNFRQSVAGKAILTSGYLYAIMGKHFESKMRLVIAALLAKSGNRTLAAYFRLVIKSLFKIVNSTSPQKAAIAFIHEGSRHPNKAARETAAQFLTILTDTLGAENSLATFMANHMLKCAATFVFDSSALTRYCGKRMLEVFMQNSEFSKLKDHILDINTNQDLSKILDQIKEKGIKEEVLPIQIVK